MVMTCAARILAKHWLGAQKSRFAWDRQAESLSPKVIAKIDYQTPKRHENEVENQAKSGQVRSRHLMTCAGASGKIPLRLVLGSEVKRHIRRSLPTTAEKLGKLTFSHPTPPQERPRLL